MCDALRKQWHKDTWVTWDRHLEDVYKGVGGCLSCGRSMSVTQNNSIGMCKFKTRSGACSWGSSLRHVALSTTRLLATWPDIRSSYIVNLMLAPRSCQASVSFLSPSKYCSRFLSAFCARVVCQVCLIGKVWEGGRNKLPEHLTLERAAHSATHAFRRAANLKSLANTCVPDELNG